VAYLVSKQTAGEPAVSGPELSRHVGRLLPAYMVPAYFVQLER
jgi:hypothetical protein